MVAIIDALWHGRRGMYWSPAEVINAESGSLDDCCTCWLCKRMGRTKR